MRKQPLAVTIERLLGYPSVAELPQKQRAGLWAFWLDGMFAALALSFTDPYYTLYMLSLHATNAQIGLVNTLTQFSAALMAIPGAALADRTGRYKAVVLFSGLISRLMWLAMLAAPWLPGGGAVWLVLAAWVVISGMGALGGAAWTALSADLVPEHLRGGYFASRTIIAQIMNLMAIPLAGLLVNAIGEPVGYQINLGLAFAVGAISLYFYSRLPEHPPSSKPDRLGTWQVVGQALRLPTFIRFTTCHAILMLGVMIGGPFINVYMAEKLGFSVGTIGIVTTVGVLASVLGMRLIGRLHDRFGITWTMRLGLGVPLIPVAWLWVTQPWQGYVVSGLSALTWAGYNLGAFNLLLASTPDEHRPRYVALYSTLTALVGAVGPAVGGWLLDATGFAPVFSLSGIIRSVGLLLFLILVREPSAAYRAGRANP